MRGIRGTESLLVCLSAITKLGFPPFPARWRVSSNSILVLVFEAMCNGAKTRLVRFGGENGEII